MSSHNERIWTKSISVNIWWEWNRNKDKMWVKLLHICWDLNHMFPLNNREGLLAPRCPLLLQAAHLLLSSPSILMTLTQLSNITVISFPCGPQLQYIIHNYMQPPHLGTSHVLKDPLSPSFYKKDPHRYAMLNIQSLFTFLCSASLFSTDFKRISQIWPLPQFSKLVKCVSLQPWPHKEVLHEMIIVSRSDFQARDEFKDGPYPAW